MTVYITRTTEVPEIFILCSTETSCKQMEIDISTEGYDNYLEIHCNGSESCKSMRINVNDYTTTKIVCYTDHACDGLHIITDNSPNIEIIMMMHRYSSNILIAAAFDIIDRININCHPNQNEHRYFQYPAGQLLEDDHLLTEIKEKYESQELPCSQINISCESGYSLITGCRYDYVLNREFDLSRILENENGANCVWVDVFQIYSGYIAIDYETVNKHNISFSSYITFNTSYNDSQLSTICRHYFGNNASTQNTVSSISNIYDNVLHIIGGYNSDGIIVEILQPPVSRLLDESVSNLDCNDLSVMKPLQLFSIVRLQSTYENKDYLFLQLFARNTTFIVTSERLIEAFFGVPISLDIFHDIASKSNGFIFTIEMIIGIACGILCLFIICCYYYKKNRDKKLQLIKEKIRRREAKLQREKDTICVKNPLVVALAVGNYHNNQILKDLEVGIDIESLKIFCNRFNYDMHHVTLNQTNPKLYWKRSETLCFLKKEAKHFNDNVDSYDGLIVVLSGHGIENYILSSDSEYQENEWTNKIKKKSIHRMFSDKYPAVRDVPRIFIFDSCDGNADYDTDWRVLGDDEQESSSEEEKESIIPTIHAQTSTRNEDQPVLGKNVRSLSTNGNSWYQGEHNPDHKLVMIHAANPGFQAKLSVEEGSYLIKQFVDRTIQNLENNDNKLLGEIIDEIEKDLHNQKRKQLIAPHYQNGTRMINLMPRENAKEADEYVVKTANDNASIIKFHAVPSESEDSYIKYSRDKPSVPMKGVLEMIAIKEGAKSIEMKEDDDYKEMEHLWNKQKQDTDIDDE